MPLTRSNRGGQMWQRIGAHFAWLSQRALLTAVHAAGEPSIGGAVRYRGIAVCLPRGTQKDMPPRAVCRAVTFCAGSRSMSNFVFPARPADFPEYDAANNIREATADLDSLVDSLTENPRNILDPDNCKALLTLTKGWKDIIDETRSRVADALTSGMSCLGTSIEIVIGSNCPDSERAEVRNALKAHLFFITYIYEQCAFVAANPTSVASSAAKSKLPSKNKSRPMEIWNWETQCVKLMRSIANIFALDMFKLWGLSNPDASVFGAVLRVVGLAFSDAPACKGSDFKIEIFRVLTAASGRYGQRDNVLQTCVHAICRNEHVPLVIAELCLYAQEIGADANLAAAAFREITKLDEAELARDTAMSRNAGIFLMEAADRLPNVALMSLSLLLPILEQEAYSMRCAVVHTLARVLVSAVGHSSSEEAIRVRESLLAVLLERCIDVNAFVRARVLQAWVLLAEKKCIPVRRVPAVVTQAVERCKDKTAAVRRSALLLLQALLQFNPYAQILPLNVFIAKAKEAKAVFEACSTANDSHRVSDASASNTAAEAEDAPKASARARMVFYDAAVEFIQQLHTAIAIAIELLGSKNTSDISESVEFIVGCHAYGVDAAAKGVCGLTMLVFSKEETIKSCARSAVVRLFIEPLKSKMMTKEDCRIIIQRMAALAAQCTLGELTSLDATFLDASIAEKGLPKEMLDTIWEWISSPHTSELPVWTLLGCYRLLPILARAVPSQFQSRIDGIVTICGADSQACALSAAQALVQLAQHNGMPRAKTISVCDTLIQVVLREVSGAALDAWFPFAEAACQAIWVLHPRPEALFASAIRSLLATSLGQKKKEGTSASSGRLSQLFFLTGQSAVRGVIRVEYAGKSRAKIADAKENAKHGISSGEADKDDALCKDLGLVPEQARQTEAESARDSAESDLADPENLIAMVSSMAARVAINTNGKYADATLRCAAGQCIGLCSATSSKLAEQNIQLLTSILARASESRLRANAAIALGDIAGRFPNTFEPWASHMFNALRDQVLGVRKTVLLVLTHLILNDMVKSRGFLSEISLKLLDVDSEVQASARLFFCEFANKQNGAALYNAIPDVISRLGTDVSEPDFQKIMKFLMSFMDKERLAENLGDRLVLRLASATDGRSARDVSFCLNQIPCSEKVLKRLVEQWKTIASRCSDDAVLSNLKSACAKAKKPSKVDKDAAPKDGEAAVVSKNSLELLERRLAKAEAGELWNSDDDEGGPSTTASADAAKGKKKAVTKGALKVSSKGNKTPSKTPVKGRGKKAKDSSDEDEDSDPGVLDDDENVAPPPAAAAVRATGRAASSRARK